MRRHVPPSAAAALLAVVFAVQVAVHLVIVLSRTLHQPTLTEVLAEVRPGSPLLVRARLAAVEDRGPDGWKLGLPDGWIAGDTPAEWRPPRTEDLLVYLDGRSVHVYPGDPRRGDESHAYYRSPRTRSLHLRCAEGRTCRDVVVVHATPAFDARMAAARLRRLPLFAVCGVLAVLGASFVAGWRVWRGDRPPSFWAAAALGSALAFGVLRLWTLDAFGAALALQVLALGWPAFAAVAAPAGPPVRRLLALADGDGTGAAAWASRAAVGAVVLTVVALPYVLTAGSWYPAARDDSLVYLFAASRFLASGSLWDGVADPRSWTYSAYPLVVAAAARAMGVHPMEVYPALGRWGAVLLPAAMAAFAYVFTRRFRVALLAAWIAGLWGGLAAYLWFGQEALPSLVQGVGWPVLGEDYHEPRFLGEYTGPHSELASYMSRTPLYPRDLGLALLWPGIALLYVGTWGALAVAALCAGAAAAVYPYYAAPAAFAFALSALLTARRLHREGRRAAAWLLVGSPVAALALFGVLLDPIVRAYKHPAGLVAYLFVSWDAPVAARHAPLVFSPVRLLSGHVFMLLAIALARRAARDVVGQDPRRRLLAGASAVASVGLGILSLASDRLHAVLGPYAWIVPWRVLLEPLVVVAAAASLEALHRTGRLRTPAAVLLLLAGALSPLHWTLNAHLYLVEQARSGRDRGQNASLYRDHARWGSQVLGTVVLREPVAWEQGPPLYARAALGALATGDNPEHPLYDPRLAGAFRAGGEAALVERMRRGEIGDVGALADGPFARYALATGACTSLGRFGPHVLLRLRR